jgi:hypothetical protein
VTIETEMKATENKLSKYNVEQLGDIPVERGDGTMRVLVSQMGGCLSLEMQEIIIAEQKGSSANTTSISALSWSSTLIGQK